jgi:hypothetical protein
MHKVRVEQIDQRLAMASAICAGSQCFEAEQSVEGANSLGCAAAIHPNQIVRLYLAWLPTLAEINIDHSMIFGTA